MEPVPGAEPPLPDPAEVEITGADRLDVEAAAALERHLRGKAIGQVVEKARGPRHA